MTKKNYQEAVLVLPRLRVQNANAISSPMTWGFPSITAFIGLMHALARRLQPAHGLEFRGVGVICHDYEAQVTEGGYTRAFRQMRNPVSKDGSTAGIVEEGRIHLDITLVFLVNLAISRSAETERQQLAREVKNTVTEMRIAGGSVLPPVPDTQRLVLSPQLRLLPDEEEDRKKEFRRMRLPLAARLCLGCSRRSATRTSRYASTVRCEGHRSRRLAGLVATEPLCHPYDACG